MPRLTNSLQTPVAFYLKRYHFVIFADEAFRYRILTTAVTYDHEDQMSNSFLKVSKRSIVLNEPISRRYSSGPETNFSMHESIFSAASIIDFAVVASATFLELPIVSYSPTLEPATADPK